MMMMMKLPLLRSLQLAALQPVLAGAAAGLRHRDCLLVLDTVGPLTAPELRYSQLQPAYHWLSVLEPSIRYAQP